MPIATVDIASVVRWLDKISFSDWPQQRFDEMRPAMVTDPKWHGFGTVVAPVIAEVMEHFPGCAPFQAMLSVVMPGHEIESHCDCQAPYWICRVHVPLTSNVRAIFVLEGEAHYLKPGFAYRINTQAEHAVMNGGETPRIHLMFDVRRACG